MTITKDWVAYSDRIGETFIYVHFVACCDYFDGEEYSYATDQPLAAPVEVSDLDRGRRLIKNQWKAYLKRAKAEYVGTTDFNGYVCRDVVLIAIADEVRIVDVSDDWGPDFGYVRDVDLEYTEKSWRMYEPSDQWEDA